MKNFALKTMKELSPSTAKLYMRGIKITLYIYIYK